MQHVSSDQHQHPPLPSHPRPHPHLPHRYNKELLSRGKFAEFLAADNRPFNQEESALFDDSAQFAYESFRNKAAESRNMAVEDMQVGGGQGVAGRGQGALAAAATLAANA
jgi:hypothetical protein